MVRAKTQRSHMEQSSTLAKRRMMTCLFEIESFSPTASPNLYEEEEEAASTRSRREMFGDMCTFGSLLALTMFGARLLRTQFE